MLRRAEGPQKLGAENLNWLDPKPPWEPHPLLRFMGPYVGELKIGRLRHCAAPTGNKPFPSGLGNTQGDTQTLWRRFRLSDLRRLLRVNESHVRNGNDSPSFRRQTWRPPFPPPLR